MNATCFCYDCHGIRCIQSRAREVENAVKLGNETQITRFMRDLRNAIGQYEPQPCKHNPNK